MDVLCGVVSVVAGCLQISHNFADGFEFFNYGDFVVVISLVRDLSCNYFV